MIFRVIDELLVKDVRQHAQRLERAGDGDAHSLDHPPLSRGEISAAEERIGFTLPRSLVSLYAAVGNGGYGPAYGLLGLVGGALQEDGNDAVSMYETFSQTDPDDPHWSWPTKLLPIVHLGCAMYYCVDCSTEDGMVVWFEPNPHELGGPWTDTFFPLLRTFRDLMTGWTNGEDALKTFNGSPKNDGP
jgi:hypothetical protein